MKKHICLNGKWKLACSDEAGRRPEEKRIDVQVPGDVTAALSKAGRLPENLFYRDNLKQAEWAGRKYWWYETEFTLKAVSKHRLELVFLGLDLFATVYVNGKKAGSSDNAFKPFRFDVTGLVKKGKNKIEVEFAPTRQMVEELHGKYPQYWSLFTPGRSLVRHAQCQFGWDWAPDALALGIWQDVFLEECDGAKIENVFVEAQLDGDCCVRVELPLLEQEELPKGVPLDKIPPYYVTGALHAGIYYNGRMVAEETVRTNGVHNFICLKVRNPKWWWPNGMGKQELYECRVTLLNGAGKMQDTMTRTFGFRSVKLEEKKLEADRISFTFLVNGERVFIKGANWVPAHCFPGVIEDKTYEYLVSRAQEANYNMLRIWGGGIYEKDRFYEECDRRGIMVWQDFANACAEPPDDDEFFLRNMIEEAEYQVKRLRNHPSVVCWCGGNESSSSHRYEPGRPGRRLCRYYYRGVVGDLSPFTPYIPGSSHGKSDFGQIQTSGETHWSMWPRKASVTYGSYRERLKDVRTVFNGEICLQGPSPLESQLRFLDRSDIWPPNEIADFHVMHHPALPEVHPRFVISQLKAAEQIIGPCGSAESFTNNAMMAHAEMVREELGFYRSTKWGNSGAMLWMYNECWPCSNWANVDFYGAMKPAYWMEKTLFAPLAVTIKRIHKNFTLHLMNDTLKNASGPVKVCLMDIHGKVFWKETLKGICPANSAVKLKSYAPSKVKGENCFLRMEWKAGKEKLSANYFPQLFKDVAFEKPKLNRTASKPVKVSGGWKTAVKISSENYVRFVYIDIPLRQVRDVTLSDNYFDLIPGEVRTVELVSRQALKKVDVKSLLK
ncbi:MAG: glycoside hydrolase family 2 protein [Kiritimatiellales bacterium]|jgi:beta-mannosidase